MDISFEDCETAKIMETRARVCNLRKDENCNKQEIRSMERASAQCIAFRVCVY